MTCMDDFNHSAWRALKSFSCSFWRPQLARPLISAWYFIHVIQLQWWLEGGVCGATVVHLQLTVMWVSVNKNDRFKTAVWSDWKALLWTHEKGAGSSAKDQGWMELIKVALNQTFKGESKAQPPKPALVFSLWIAQVVKQALLWSCHVKLTHFLILLPTANFLLCWNWELVWQCVKATWTGIVPDCLKYEGMNLHHWLTQPSFGRWETMMSSANSSWGNKHTTSPKASVSLQSSTWPVATLVQPPKIVSSGLSVTSCASLAPDDLEQLPTLTSTKLPACDNVPRPSPAEVNVNLWPGRNLCKPESSASFDSLFFVLNFG